jgi:hypothetical protein
MSGKSIADDRSACRPSILHNHLSHSCNNPDEIIIMINNNNNNKNATTPPQQLDAAGVRHSP